MLNGNLNWKNQYLPKNQVNERRKFMMVFTFPKKAAKLLSAVCLVGQHVDAVNALII